MRRGEIWTVAARADYVAKPRPAVILQSDVFDGTGSVTICLFTGDDTEAPLTRLRIPATEGNGLLAESRLMVDKVTTVPRNRLGRRIGQLTTAEMGRLGRALIVFLGLAETSPSP